MVGVANARKSLVLLLTVFFLTVVPLHCTAHDLIVPLTGHRIRPIEAETLFHTLFDNFSVQQDGTTYVSTGDIPAMWLRDSSSQTVPYIRFQNTFPSLRPFFAGVIERNALNLLTDPYANAFNVHYQVWERKWEVDSLAWPAITLYVYWHSTHDRKIFTPTVHRALRKIVDTYRCEQLHPTCSRYRYEYHVYTTDRYNPNTNLIWSAFRPSDDPVRYRFNIPQNALASIGLRAIAELAKTGYNDTNLSNEADSMSAQIHTGILRYGLVWNPKYSKWIYAYETDGYTNYNFMDDANIPNLTGMPYDGWSSAFDPLYLNTRAFTLSKNNPFYFSGKYAEGLGSPHTPYGYVWPLGIMARALTATSSSEVLEALTTLAETTSTDGLVHESFYPNGYWRFTRTEFGWGNAVYAELLFQTSAGYRATRFVYDDMTMQPFEPATQAPDLVGLATQIDNIATIFEDLRLLLARYNQKFYTPYRR